MSIELLNTDCMEYMATQPENAFDLAIVDPPYGINVTAMNMGSRQNVRPDKSKNWDDSPPGAEYFDELRRVSKDQIIWGGGITFHCRQHGAGFYGTKGNQCMVVILRRGKWRGRALTK